MARVKLVKYKILVASAMFLASFSASAANPLPGRIADRDALRHHAEEIRRQFEPGMRFAHLEARERRKVEVDLERMEALLHKHEPAVDMRPEDLADIFNVQERINATLLGREEARMVCRKERSTGSKMYQRNCRRTGDVEVARDQQEKWLRDNVGHRWVPRDLHRSP